MYRWMDKGRVHGGRVEGLINRCIKLNGWMKRCMVEGLNDL